MTTIRGASVRCAVAIAVLAWATACSKKSDASDEPVDRVAEHLRKILEIVEATPEDCDGVVERMDGYVEEHREELDDLRAQVEAAEAAASKEERERQNRRIRGIVLDMQRRSGGAARRFAEACPDHVREIQRVMSWLLDERPSDERGETEAEREEFEREREADEREREEYQAALRAEAERRAGAGRLPPPSPSGSFETSAPAESCVRLFDKLCADVGEEATACRSGRAGIGRLTGPRCEAMLADYDALLARVQVAERGRQPISDETWAKALGGSPPAFGPADAAVTLVVVVDYECPFCRQAARVLPLMRERYSGHSLRVVLRNLPLPMHRHAELAAQAALAAHAQGKYWLWHDAVAEASGPLDRETLEDLAGTAGLDLERVRRELDAGTHAAAVAADKALAAELGANGTPTFLLDRKRIHVNPGYPGGIYQQLDAALRERGLPAPE